MTREIFFAIITNFGHILFGFYKRLVEYLVQSINRKNEVHANWAYNIQYSWRNAYSKNGCSHQIHLYTNNTLTYEHIFAFFCMSNIRQSYEILPKSRKQISAIASRQSSVDTVPNPLTLPCNNNNININCCCCCFLFREK